MNWESSDVVHLPVGIEHDGKRYREVIIDEMTGFDEEQLALPKNKRNPGKAMTDLLRRVIQEVPGVTEPKAKRTDLLDPRIVRNMYQADRDAVLVGLRLLSFGYESDIDWTCPSCELDNSEKVDLRTMDIREWPGDAPVEFEFELPRGIEIEGELRQKGVIRLPTGKDSEPLAQMARVDPGAATTAMLTACIRHVGGKAVDSHQVKMMSSRDRAYLGSLFRERLPGVRFEVDCTCAGCGRAEMARVDLAAFFSPT